MPNFTPLGALSVLDGLGLLTAAGCERVRVRYRVVVEARRDGIVARGTLRGEAKGLHPIWLEPDAQLRLEGGQCLDVSVTELAGDEAMFESIGKVPDLTKGSRPKAKRRLKPS